MFSSFDIRSVAACLVIGYLCGTFLTADVVAHVKAGKSAFSLGTGNPGMANVGHELGTGAAAVVLAGDLGKVIVACLVAAAAVGGWSAAAAAWTGAGAVLGHLFPAWHRFRGGKGVACTCAAIYLAWPAGGAASLVIGLAVLALAGHLGIVAVAIAAAYVVLVAVAGPAGVLLPALVLLALSLVGNGASCMRALRGEERPASLYRKLHERRK